MWCLPSVPLGQRDLGKATGREWAHGAPQKIGDQVNWLQGPYSLKLAEMG